MEKYLFTVRHPQHGEARVTAEDRLHAVIEAAHSWGIMKWSGIARACEVVKGEKAPEKPYQALRARSPRGGAKKKKGDRHGDQNELSGNRGGGLKRQGPTPCWAS